MLLESFIRHENPLTAGVLRLVVPVGSDVGMKYCYCKCLWINPDTHALEIKLKYTLDDYPLYSKCKRGSCLRKFHSQVKDFDPATHQQEFTRGCFR